MYYPTTPPPPLFTLRANVYQISCDIYICSALRSFQMSCHPNLNEIGTIMMQLDLYCVLCRHKYLKNWCDSYLSLWSHLNSCLVARLKCQSIYSTFNKAAKSMSMRQGMEVSSARCTVSRAVPGQVYSVRSPTRPIQECSRMVSINSTSTHLNFSNCCSGIRQPRLWRWNILRPISHVKFRWY